MADEPAPAVAVASGGDAPTVDQQAAGQASAAAGASAVLAGQAGQAADSAAASADLAGQAAVVAQGADEAAAAAAEAAAETASDRSAVEQFMASQTQLNQALVARVEQLSAPPAPEPARDGPKPDRAPERRQHWLERRIGANRKG